MSERSLPSVMNHSFANVPAPQIQRSMFDRSHGYKTAFDHGQLIPFFLDEVLPGDTFNLQANCMARIQSLIYPVMDNVFLDTFFFFVPNRILWDNWERFNGAQDDPDDSTDFIVPVMGPFDDIAIEFDSNSLPDYFGIPTKVDITTLGDDSGHLPCALPFRAYNLIWNEWFRDENLQDSVYCPKDDGPDIYINGLSEKNYKVLNRAKKADYFSSALPFAQKGDDVSLPIGISAPVIGDGSAINFDIGGGGFRTLMMQTTAVGQTMRVANTGGSHLSGASSTGVTPQATENYLGLTQDPANSHMFADLSGATAATINELREAIAFQQVLEKDARGGTRYTEILQQHWGVTVPDFRLQRPEYLGGSSERINISAVAQTTPNEGTPTNRNAKGSLAAYAAVGSRSGFTKSFVEHGFIIGLVNVRADITYQQGFRKLWHRRTRFDFALPTLAHLGEQPILNKEIYYADNGFSGDLVFGYQERYAEYRYFPSQVTGAMRSNYTGSLDAWHLALNFEAQPNLNDAFIQDDPPLDRVVQVPDEPTIIMDTYFRLRTSRALPVYAVPGLLRL